MHSLGKGQVPGGQVDAAVQAPAKNRWSAKHLILLVPTMLALCWHNSTAHHQQNSSINEPPTFVQTISPHPIVFNRAKSEKRPTRILTEHFIDQLPTSVAPSICLLEHSSGSHCLALVIDAQTILTSAHCHLQGVIISEMERSLMRKYTRVPADKLRLRCDFVSCTSGVDVPIKDVLRHPEYEPLKRNNDIALLHVQPPSDSAIRPIGIASFQNCTKVRHNVTSLRIVEEMVNATTAQMKVVPSNASVYYHELAHFVAAVSSDAGEVLLNEEDALLGLATNEENIYTSVDFFSNWLFHPETQAALRKTETEQMNQLRATIAMVTFATLQIAIFTLKSPLILKVISILFLCLLCRDVEIVIEWH